MQITFFFNTENVCPWLTLHSPLPAVKGRIFYRLRSLFSFLATPAAAHAVSFPAEWHLCTWRLALHGGSRDPPGLAQIKVATENCREDHGCDPRHWVFREIQPLQMTGDPPLEVTHLSNILIPKGQTGSNAYSES